LLHDDISFLHCFINSEGGKTDGLFG